MAARADDARRAEAGKARSAWRDHPSFGMAVGFLAVIVTVLGTGIALGVLMLGIVGEVREDVREVRRDVRELRRDVGELRERMVRVESKLEVLAGEWPAGKGSRRSVNPGGGAARAPRDDSRGG